jgi:hypothetical protein
LTRPKLHLLSLTLKAALVLALKSAARKGFKIERREHSINLALAGSDLLIQLQTDSRYQDFILRARLKKVLGYRMKPEDS